MRGTTLNTKIHPTQPRGGHPSHSNLVRGKLTSPTPNPAGDGTSGLTSYPRRRSKVSEATCLRPQRSAPSRTRTRAVRPRVHLIANQDSNTVVLQQIHPSIKARYIRLLPTKWHNHISMRMELYGCKGTIGCPLK